MRYNKSYSEAIVRPLYERWTPTARITVFDKPIWSTTPDRPWAWGMGARYVPAAEREMWIDQDGSAGTPIEHPTDAPGSLDHLLFDVTSVGYQLLAPRQVCVIGAGGGRDVLTALRAGAQRVEAVEINPAIVEAVSGPFGEFSGDVYHRPGVVAVVSEGRSHLMRTTRRYDLIQISLVDSWAATAAGAYSLSENFLYTREALQLYWDRLSEDGAVSISRWTGNLHQLESARLVLLALDALAHLGVPAPREHLAFVEAGTVGTLLLSRQPFTTERLARLSQISEQRGFRLVWPPTAGARADHVLRVLTDGAGDYQRAGLDLSAPCDDRPFFFQVVSILGNPDLGAVQAAGVNGDSVLVLRALIVSLLVLALAMFLAPFLFAGRLPRTTGFWRGSAYFSCLGLGFMLVEIPWVQRSILFLGHPSYATATVLAALLMGAGLGSLAAARVPLRRLLRWRLALPAALLAAQLLVGPLFAAALGLPLPARVALCACCLAPAGFVMGFAFPSGMVRFGAFSVLASALSLGLAMLLGFSGVGAVGLGAYLAAALLLGDAPASGLGDGAGAG